MRSFPFDSDVTYDELGNPEYDRGADSTILANFIHLMFTDGVFPNPSTGLQVTASSETMSVIVLPGNCMIQGRMGIEENNRTLVFEASGTSYDRIDSVVARLNTNHDYRDIDLYVIKGKESSSPVVPELTRTGGIYELRLANVFIAKNTTIISPERITDTRLIGEDCGIVTSNPNPVDTTTIFKQYQAALDEYLQYVEECIDGTTAGNLQKQIEEKAPISHASADMRYGVASETEYGHVKICNDYTVIDNSKPPIPRVPTMKAIGDMCTDISKSIDEKSKIIVEAVTLTGNGSNWILVSSNNRKLIAAHSVRDDTSYYIMGIQKQSATGVYTLIFSEMIGAGAKQAVWLTWLDN